MADDSKRRRGRKRGRGQRHAQSQRPEEETQEEQDEPADEEEEPDPDLEAADDTGGSGRRRFGLPFRRGDNGEDDGDDDDDEREPDRERQVRSRGAKPMDFWRRGKARPYREAADQQRQMGLWQRITGFYFPPWVPVVGIIFLVFGILGLLFITRSAVGAPRSGDHWHAPYQIFICGDQQPVIPDFQAAAGSPGTHGDGIMHLHPFAPRGEGAGSNLGNFFREGGGKLDGDELKIPGRRETHKNGDECPDGTIGIVQVSINGQPQADYSRYIPEDGDQVRVSFGPSEEILSLADRTVIADEQATREVTIEVSGNESATQFTPATIDLSAGEAVRVRVQNVADVSHSFRASGPDGEYGTGDDFVVTPDGDDPEESSGVLLPGEEGTVVIRFESPGSIEFRDDTAQSATGEIIVGEAAPDDDGEGEGEDNANGEDIDVDVELEVTATLAGFETAQLKVEAGETFRITITNGDEFLQNLRIAGPDGEYRTDDDLTSGEVENEGDTAVLVGKIDDPGTYEFRDDFHTNLTGTITVE